MLKQMIPCRNCNGSMLRQIAFEFTLTQFGRFEFSGRLELSPTQLSASGTLYFDNSAAALALLFSINEISKYRIEQDKSTLHFECFPKFIMLSVENLSNNELSSSLSSKLILIKNIIKHYQFSQQQPLEALNRLAAPSIEQSL